MTDVAEPSILAVSHTIIGYSRYSFTTTTRGIVARKLPQGKFKYDGETNLVAVLSDGVVVWRREGKVAQDSWHFFSNERDAHAYASRN